MLDGIVPPLIVFVVAALLMWGRSWYLRRHRGRERRADVVIVIAGMDGVLPSVVGGLVDRPVIAVPTSVGYGAAFQGVAPLLTMLNSCAANVVVVNIDSGFKAGYVAALIARRSQADDAVPKSS